jgi:hypothetical protein
LFNLLQVMLGQLITEVDPAEEFAPVARRWLDGVLEEVLTELRDGLRTRPAAALPRRLNLGLEPWGEPGQVLGILSYGRDEPVGRRRTVFTEKGWQWLLTRLGDSPFLAGVEIIPLDDRGFPRHDEVAVVMVMRDMLSPNWVRLWFSAPAMTGWAASAQVQARWAGFVRTQAAQAGACAGGMSDGGWPGTGTALERATSAVACARKSREELRGYTWVTIVAAELAARLGGADALRDSEAFCEVSELPDGSLWLQATPAINDFTWERVRRVFEALAPVLIGGTADPLPTEPARIVPGVDAADYW